VPVLFSDGLLLVKMLAMLLLARIAWHFGFRYYFPLAFLRGRLPRQFRRHRFLAAAELLHDSIQDFSDQDRTLSPRVLEAMAHLARVYQRYGHRSLARRLTEAGTIYLADYKGQHDREFAHLCFAIARALCETGSPGQGIDLLNDCVALFRRHFGEHSERLADVLQVRAEFLTRTGQPERAIEDLKLALYIRESLIGSPQSEIVSAWLRFAEADMALGELTHAAGAVRLARSSWLTSSRDRAAILAANADLAEKKGNRELALELLTDAYRIAPRRDRYLRAKLLDERSNLLFRARREEEAVEARVQATQIRGELRAFPVHLWLTFLRQP
jgi:tetratricopeptide (TPR) repeat protein